MPKVANPMTMINPFENNFFDKSSGGHKKGHGGRSKNPMDDIFGVSGGYTPYLGTGPGTINGPFEMDNDYEAVEAASTPGNLNNTNGSTSGAPVDRRGSGSSASNKPQRSPKQNNFEAGPNRNRNNLPDFGDRYSANRTKDRQRREAQRIQQQQPQVINYHYLYYPLGPR